MQRLFQGCDLRCPRLQLTPSKPPNWPVYENSSKCLHTVYDSFVSITPCRCCWQFKLASRRNCPSSLALAFKQSVHSAVEPRDAGSQFPHPALEGFAIRLPHLQTIAPQQFAQAHLAFDVPGMQDLAASKKRTVFLRLLGLAMNTPGTNQAALVAQCRMRFLAADLHQHRSKYITDLACLEQNHWQLCANHRRMEPLRQRPSLQADCRALQTKALKSGNAGSGSLATRASLMMLHAASTHHPLHRLPAQSVRLRSMTSARSSGGIRPSRTCQNPVTASCPARP